MNEPIKPVDFSQLPKISPDREALVAVIDHFFVSADHQTAAVNEIVGVLQTVLRGECQLSTNRFKLVKADRCGERLPKNAVYLVIAAAPGGPKGIIALNPITALALIDRLLGGELTEIPQARQLTEIEQGVVSYLAVKLLKTFHDAIDHPTMALHLETIVESRDELESFWKESTYVAVGSTTVTLPELKGTVQVILSDHLLSEVMKRNTPVETLDPSSAQKRLDSWGALQFPLYALIGETNLNSEQVAALGQGDVVLLDQTHGHVIDGKVAGDVILKTDRRQGPVMQAEILSSTKPAQVKVKQLLSL